MRAEAPLPIRPELAEHELLPSYVRRTAGLNHLQIAQMVGRQAVPVNWERLPPQVYDRLAMLTTKPATTLASRTLTGRYPGAAIRNRLLGRRLPQVPAWCPRCGHHGDLETRLRALVTCVRCGVLFTDADGYVEEDVDEHLVLEQEQLRHLLAQQPSDCGTHRLMRLQRLTGAMAWSISTAWPPLAPGESPARRAAAMQTARRGYRADAEQQSPAATAVLLRLCWQASELESTTTEKLGEIEAHGLDLPDAMTNAAAEMQRTSAEAIGDLATWAACLPALTLEEVPHAFTLDTPAILPPQREVTTRRAYSILIAHGLKSRETGGLSSVADATQVFGRKLRAIDRPVQAAQRLLQQTHARAMALVMAQTIFADGAVDYHRRRAEFRNRRDVPKRLIRALPSSIQSWDRPEKVAAVWVWLDATRGCIAGGPHSDVEHRTVEAFHDQLGPEGRLTLRVACRV